jgi:hypothetical protein
MSVVDDLAKFNRRHRRTLRAAAIGLAAIYFFLSFLGLPNLIPDKVWEIVTLFCILFFVVDISNSIPPPAEGLSLGDQMKLYSDLHAECQARRPRRVTFYHFSGNEILSIVETLFKSGCEIDIYTQSPHLVKSLDCSYQANRIDAAEHDFRTRFHRPVASVGGGVVRLWRSDVPLTIRAVVLDDDVIILGWYVYAKVPGGKRAGEGPSAGKFAGDRVRLSGHDQLGVVLRRSHPQFEEVQDFLRKYQKGIAATEVWAPAPTGILG